jgi:hypothetical protein
MGLSHIGRQAKALQTNYLGKTSWHTGVIEWQSQYKPSSDYIQAFPLQAAALEASPLVKLSGSNSLYRLDTLKLL